MPRTGLWGVFVLMLVENVFPPIPSGLILPLAGVAAVRGDLVSVRAGTKRRPLVPVLTYSAVGSVLRSSVLCGVGFVLQANYAAVTRYLDPVAKPLTGAILAVYLYLYRVTFFRPGKVYRNCWPAAAGRPQVRSPG